MLFLFETSVVNVMLVNCRSVFNMYTFNLDHQQNSMNCLALKLFCQKVLFVVKGLFRFFLIRGMSSNMLVEKLFIEFDSL